jgi:hypothetical protein
METLSKDLFVTKGDDKSWNLELSDGEGTPYNITGWTVYFTIKTHLTDLDVNALIRKEITSHTSPTSGITTINLSALEMELAVGVYYYDIQILTLENKIYTIQKGKFFVEYDVTRGT